MPYSAQPIGPNSVCLSMVSRKKSLNIQLKRLSVKETYSLEAAIEKEGDLRQTCRPEMIDIVDILLLPVRLRRILA